MHTRFLYKRKGLNGLFHYEFVIRRTAADGATCDDPPFFIETTDIHAFLKQLGFSDIEDIVNDSAGDHWNLGYSHFEPDLSRPFKKC